MPLSVFSQQRFSISGKILDKDGATVENITFLARSIPAADFVYAITDTNGKYKVDLLVSTKYAIRIQGLGRKTLHDTLELKKDLQKNYFLEDNEQQLEAVLINARAAVKVNGDTTAYRTEYFTTGSERKVRDILENLPGVEVDRDGNVLVDGKEVTKLLVDGKVFFSGDEKLGVNNIPSDVIDEIEIIQNYSAIPFMKDLNVNEEIALNLKLKQDKRNFIFGDASAGGGLPDQYTAKANTFYYSKNLGINSISGAVNSGDRVFTTKDFIDFEGGSLLAISDPEKLASLLSSDFAISLNNTNFKKNDNKVFTLNVVKEINSRNTFTAYSVMLNDLSEFDNLSTRFFPVSNFVETLSNRSNNEAFQNLTRLKWQYRRKANKYWDFDIGFKLIDNSIESNVSSIVTVQDSLSVVSTATSSNIQVDLNVTHTARIASDTRIEWRSEISIFDYTTDRLWRFNQPVFETLTGFENTESDFLLDQEINATRFSTKSQFKHFWDFNDGWQWQNSTLTSYSNNSYININDTQGTGQNLEENGFNNDASLQTIELAFRTGVFHKTPGIELQTGLMVNNIYYAFNNRSIDNKEVGIVRLLPYFDLEFKMAKSKTITFKYSTDVDLPEVSQLANRLQLTNYNSITAGSSTIRDQYNHRFRLFFSKRFHRNLNLIITNSYSLSNRSIRLTRNIVDRELINRFILLDKPVSNFNAAITAVKSYSNWRTSVSVNYRNVILFDIINNDSRKLQNESYGLSLNTSSKFKNFVNFKFNLNPQLSINGNPDRVRFLNTRLSLDLDHDISKSLIANVSINQNYFTRLEDGSSNNFGFIDTGILYDPIKSPWFFEVKGYNVFNVESQRSNSVTDFIISDSEVFLLPARVIFKVGYNF